MDFVRRFGLIVCAALVIAASAGFLLMLHTADGDWSKNVLDMDFALAAEGDSSAELIWTAIAAAIGVFAVLSLLTALVPSFGSDRAAVATDDAKAELDTAAMETRMRASAESVDGVEHAETYVYASDDRVTGGKIDLFLEEDQDAGAVSDEVAARVRSMFRDEYDVEPADGFEIDTHQPRRFFQSKSGQTA
jgi:hypothetical protein